MNKSIIISLLFHVVLITVAILGLPKIFSDPEKPIILTVDLEVLENVMQDPPPSLVETKLPNISIKKPNKPVLMESANSIIKAPQKPAKSQQRNKPPENIPPVPRQKPNPPELKISNDNTSMEQAESIENNTITPNEKLFDDMLRDLAEEESENNNNENIEKSEISLAEKTIAKLAEDENELIIIPEPGEINKIALIIKQQVDKEWSRPPGLKTSGEIAIGLLITLSRDGSITHLEIDNEAKARMQNEPTFRPLVESALRAVRKASPIKGLPQKRYMIWKKLKLNFKPPETMS